MSGPISRVHVGEDGLALEASRARPSCIRPSKDILFSVCLVYTKPSQSPAHGDAGSPPFLGRTPALLPARV